MPVASMIELLEAGVHFGHQTQRWNPKMKPYIYGARNGIYVIDLRKTTDLLDEAYNLVRDYAAKGRNVLFVGTIIFRKFRKINTFFNFSVIRFLYQKPC